MQFETDKNAIEACEMHIVGHKIFVRMKDIPMYLSKKTRDSIRNRYSHSVEVGLGTEYLLNSVSRRLSRGVDLNFYGIAKIIGLVHDIGHTAFSHDGEMILDRMLRDASKALPQPIRFSANLNNFRRIEKYALFGRMPREIQRYALASLIKRKKELKLYPEYLILKNDLAYGLSLEERYLRSKGIVVDNSSGKTILCQAMDLADENRYRITDIIDALNIYSKSKLSEILLRSISSEVTVGEIARYIQMDTSDAHVTVKQLLISLLEQESHAKTEFQNTMNSISMAFNRNFYLDRDGRLVPENKALETLREEFQKIAATYIWGSKKIQKIKKPFKHYFETVADYFIDGDYNPLFIDSMTYRNALESLAHQPKGSAQYRHRELLLMRNFLGGLTNPKIIELYKRIRIEEAEEKCSCKIDKRAKLIEKTPIGEFEKRLQKYIDRVGKSYEEESSL